MVGKWQSNHRTPEAARKLRSPEELDFVHIDFVKFTVFTLMKRGTVERSS